MKYTVIQRFISKNRSHVPLKPIGVVVHETATPNATADAEFNYFNNNLVNASAHAFIDDKAIIQTVPLNEKAWHAGRTANSRYIGIELCHFDSKERFDEVWKRAVWYFAYLFINVINIKVISKDNLMSHYEVSNKWRETDHTDPIDYFKNFGKTVEDFRNAVQIEINNILQIKKENVLKMENIVVYGNDVDKRAAEYLADYFQCPIIYKDNVSNVLDFVENIYVVGGKWKPIDKAVLISGTDRYDTIKEVLKFMKKI